MRKLAITLTSILLLASLASAPSAFSSGTGPTVFQQSPEASYQLNSGSRVDFTFMVSDPDGCCSRANFYIFKADGSTLFEKLNASRYWSPPDGPAKFGALFDFAQKHFGVFTIKAEVWDNGGNRSPLTTIGVINVPKADNFSPSVESYSNQSATTVKHGETFTIDFNVRDDVGCCTATEVWLSTLNVHEAVLTGSAIALTNNDVTNINYRATFTIPTSLSGGTYNIRMGATDFSGKGHNIESSKIQSWGHTFHGTIFVDAPIIIPTPTPIPSPADGKKSTIPAPPGGYIDNPELGIYCDLEQFEDYAWCFNQRAAVVAEPSPTPTPSVSPTPSLTPAPAPTASVTPSPLTPPAVIAVPTPSLTPTPITTPTPSLTPTPITTPTPSLTPTPISTPIPTLTPTPSPLPSPSSSANAITDAALVTEKEKLAKESAAVADLKSALDLELLKIATLRSQLETELLEVAALKSKLQADLAAISQDRAKVKSELDSVALMKKEAETLATTAKANSDAAIKAKQEADAAKKAVGKVSTITCVNNAKKLTWQITSAAPKCPKGYVKR
jgi:hypothetical protein